MKKLIWIFAAVAAAGGLAACSDKTGPRLREIERFSEMTDEEIDAAKEACYKISTTDYNCAELIPATPGMSTEDWKALAEQTKICRKSQALSFNTCLRGKGVRYSEFH